MLLNRTKILLILGILACGLTLAPDSVYGFSGRVTVGNVDAAPGEKVGVPVYLGGNDVAFFGLRLPFRFNSTDLIADSISRVGSILDPRMNPFVSIDHDSQYVGVTVIPPFDTTGGIPRVTVDSGLLVTFWFTVSPSAGPQVITIDSLDTVDTTLSPQFTLILRRLEFVINSPRIDTLIDSQTGDTLIDTLQISVPVIPEFTPGSVTLIQTDVGDDDEVLIPRKFDLNQNYPNPFNPSTTIGFSLPARSAATLEIYNILGQSVERLHSGILPAGDHKFSWDAARYPSGVYFYRLKSSQGVLTKKMLLVK